MAVDAAAAAPIILDEVKTSRTVAKKIENRAQPEGVGVTVQRSIGGAHLRNLDPFLLLDKFNLAPPAGFGDHPHRGMMTVTYVLSGPGVEHEDFAGHRGVVTPGGIQWMTAGRGIVHAEMPAGAEPTVGLQLWVNLRGKDKMIEPEYQELTADSIPSPSKDGVTVNIIAGKSMGLESPVFTKTPTAYLDVIMEGGKEFQQAVPAGWNSFIFIISGSGTFGPDGSTTASEHSHTLVLSNDGSEDGVKVRSGSDGCRFVLISGEPLKEPTVQHGPFVMSTREQIMEAFMDFQSGRNGFERAIGFRSEIAKKLR